MAANPGNPTRHEGCDMTVRRTAPRRLSRLMPAAVLVLAAPLAGCGDQTSSASPDASSSSPSSTETTAASGGGEPFATDRAWVARVETGSDEVADGVAYVRFDPSSGATKVTEITGPPLDFEPTEAGLLRVLDRSGRLFEWTIDEDTATEVDPVEVANGSELAPYFDGAD